MSLVIVGASLLNTKTLEGKLLQAFEEWTEKDVNEDYWEEQFIFKDWPYRGATKRKNPGAFIEDAGDPRDIIDYGDLYRSGVKSYSFSMGTSDASASWNWDAENSSGKPYARYVHEGEGTNITARPWTDELYYPQKFETSDVRLALVRRIKAVMGSK
jgi:hypothetical protein